MTALERAITALEFYANAAAWDDDGGQHASTPAEIDRGRRAREALQEMDRSSAVIVVSAKSVA